MLYVLNMAFFVLYLARAPMFFRHTTDVLRLRDKRLLCLFLPFILCECAALSSFATGALFSIQNGMYTRGAAYDLLFLLLSLLHPRIPCSYPPEEQDNEAP